MGVGTQGTEGELHRVGLAGHRGQLPAQGADDETFVAPLRRQLPRAPGEGRVAPHPIEVFHRNRNPLQHTQINSCGQRAIRHISFGAQTVGVPGLVGREYPTMGVMIGNRPFREIAGCGFANTKIHGELCQ